MGACSRCHYHTRRLISHSERTAGVDSVHCVSAGSEQWWTQQATDRKPSLQNLKDEHGRYPGSTAEENPVTMIGLHLSLCPSVCTLDRPKSNHWILPVFASQLVGGTKPY